MPPNTAGLKPWRKGKPPGPGKGGRSFPVSPPRSQVRAEQAKILTTRSFELAEMQAAHISRVLQRGNPKEMRRFVPSAMMAFGIAADKVLKQVPPAQVQQQNLIVNMFGGLGKKLESSLSTVIVEHDKQEHEKPILTENVTPEPVPEPVTEPLGLVPESIPPVVVCEPELSSNLINPCK